MPDITDRPGTTARWAWFFGLWLVSATATAAVAYLLRFLLPG
ncbi:MAG: hypothetical protein JWL84_5196 [Rhodospirillales bacterium]|jgi:hypothetical protein|nr:hypothetical protein [Rhodospirillales bacterium]